LLGLVLAGLFLFWPAFVWHGEGGFSGTEWKWDIHTTVACCIWWGSLIVMLLIIALGKRLSPSAEGDPVKEGRIAPVIIGAVVVVLVALLVVQLVRG
jgi:hypothetical protein